MSQIVIISGPPGSGKTSVAESLCGRYDRTVHLDTDQLYSAIRMGYTKPWLPGSQRQNEMVSRAAARASTAYVRDLFAVFVDAVVGPNTLGVYLEELGGAGVPVHFALLMPSLDETLRRAQERKSTVAALTQDVVRQMWERFSAHGDFAGCTIDNTRLAADETADRIMDACGQGECLVLSPD